MLALLPMLVLTGWSLVVLLVIGWRHGTEADSRLAGILSAIGIALAGLAVVWLWTGDARAEGPSLMVYLDGYRFGAELLVLFVALTTCLLSLRFMGRQRLLAPEYYALILFATIGMQLMVASSDLVLTFLGLEVMSVSVYVLAGYDRFRRSSAEAALKYFLVGAFASGFLLYGIALTYGATGQTNLPLIGRVLAAMPPSTLAHIGLGMLLIGFGFKVAAVPFHMWAPDVYDGAPTPVTGFMATGVKTAGFVALVRLLSDGFPSLGDLWQPALAVLAILSIVTGNIVALAQTSVKRLLAYSSIAHAGYLLVAVWAASPSGYMAVLLYLWAYSLTSLASFGVVAAVEHVGARTVRIEDLEGLFRTRPWGAMSMSVCLLSLLGFPGTFGFIGKWLIIGAALERGQVILPVLVGLGSLVSLGYYLPVIMAMTMKPERSPEAHRQVLFSQAGKLVIAGSVALIILMGIWPRIPLQLGRKTVDSMASQKVVASEQP
jgi:NADH-quinone oxidoreductase subunit N